jgi:hypothetical protein
MISGMTKFIFNSFIVTNCPKKIIINEDLFLSNEKNREK